VLSISVVLQVFKQPVRPSLSVQEHHSRSGTRCQQGLFRRYPQTILLRLNEKRAFWQIDHALGYFGIYA